MFQLINKELNISADEEHSVDELIEYIKPFLASDNVKDRAGRLVYFADTCHSDNNSHFYKTVFS
ncbi:MAG: hypothetical protein HPY30_04095 [Gammaproteobacteria bacterium (ex Lamellibrachia satsuma)]|nr:MAG: hypothetical protein HPY30_04095 [Gammaproteobacteria bacterium (ex Lamellibrachia satsuma)]